MDLRRVDPLYALSLLLLLIAVALAWSGAIHHHNNNFLIFRSSFEHLMRGANIYAPYPDEHFSLFKYGPPFALLMAPFAKIPEVIGSIIWSLISVVCLLYAISRSPIENKQKFWALLILIPGLIGSVQAFQSNMLVASLALLSWILLEEKKIMAACLLISFLAMVKVFGGLLFLLLLFDEYRSESGGAANVMAKAVIAVVLLAASPVLAIGIDQTAVQYQNWLDLLRADHVSGLGYSLMGVLALFIPNLEPSGIQIAGLVLCVSVFFWRRSADQQVRWVAFVSLMYFFVVFNHKSESPTFIIPMLAFALDYVQWRSDKRWRYAGLAFTLIFVSYFSSDLCPRWFRTEVLHPYALKVWPFLILWPLCLYRMISPKPAPVVLTPRDIAAPAEL